MKRYANLTPLPERIARLPELAIDLWWSWHPAREVFRRLDYSLWRATAHNPVRMLWTVPPATLARAAADPDFLKALEGWRNDAKLKIGKADQKAYDDVVPAFTSGRKKGFDEYAELNKKL